MGPVPKTSDFQAPLYPEPAPADYSDEVTTDDLVALRAMVAAEMEGEEWEMIDGPAW